MIQVHLSVLAIGLYDVALRTLQRRYNRVEIMWLPHSLVQSLIFFTIKTRDELKVFDQFWDGLRLQKTTL